MKIYRVQQARLIYKKSSLKTLIKKNFDLGKLGSHKNQCLANFVINEQLLI